MRASISIPLLYIVFAACGGAPHAGVDAGVGVDAGAGVDTGVAVDAGSPVDAGPGVDSGTPIDGGPSDAGASPTIWHPTPGTSWQWQLSGTLDTTVDVAMYDIDLFDTSAAQIQALHDAGRKVVCYFSAGTYEPGRPDSASYPAAVLGNHLVDWPAEQWLDVRDSRVLALVTARLDVAATKHCDGVEPDNVDGYANDTGFPLTAADQLAFLRGVIAAGHSRGLSVGLKNDLDQIPDLVADADWALDEQCFEYTECDLLAPFVAAHKAVFEVEYNTMPAAFCTDANTRDFDSLYKHVSLDAFRVACR